MRIAKVLPILAAALLIAGCPRARPGSDPDPRPPSDPVQAAKKAPEAAAVPPAAERGPVPPEVVAAIPGRIAALRPGMSVAQALETLGLSGYEVLSTTGGPKHRRKYRYFPDRKNLLRLVFDCSASEEGRFISADLWGEWRKPDESSSAPDEDMLAAARGSTAFAAGLYRRLRARPGNLFLSPFSVCAALAMAAAGAGGRTEAELAEALRLGPERPRAHGALGAVIRRVNARVWRGSPLDDEDDPDEGKPSFEIVVANALFAQRGQDLLPEFVEGTRRDYGAGLLELDLAGDPEGSRKAINDWVLEKTRKRIPEILGSGGLDADARLVLASAIYFLAPWDKPFDESFTSEGDFRIGPEKAAKARFMRRQGPFQLADAGSYRALAIPYRGRDLAMIVVLPKAVDGLKDVEAGLDAAALSALLRPGPSVEVELRLPKFEIRAACDLREALVEMGIRDAFSRDRADFSGMTGKRGFFLGSVVHRSFVTVNEVGTEAGAATAIETASGIPENVVDFAVDHPFLFLVADWKTGAVLFMGRVADPAK